MAGIFISYRRDDSAGHAGRLFDRLREQFGGDGAPGVFMDVEGIAPGTDFVQAIHKAVSGCGVVLAVIGPAWCDCTDAQGRRRLEDREDFVRLEIASALGLNKVVVPVLVHDAQMPTEEQLPQDLKTLARRQAVTLTDANWDSDVAQLVGTLRRALGAVSRTGSQENHWQRVGKLLSRPVPIALVLALVAAGYAWRALRQPGAEIALSQPSASVPVAPTSPAVAQTDAALKTEAQEGTLLASVGVLDFGNLRLGAHGALDVLISNRGPGAVALAQIGFAGEAQDDYSFERECGQRELAINTSCTVRVRFKPSEPGPRKALLSIEYRGRTSPLIVKLWGNGASSSEVSSSQGDAARLGRLSSAARQQE